MTHAEIDDLLRATRDLLGKESVQAAIRADREVWDQYARLTHRLMAIDAANSTEWALEALTR